MIPTEVYLNVMFGKFFGKGSSTSRNRVDSIVDSNLAILVIQKMVDVLSTFFYDLLP